MKLLALISAFLFTFSADAAELTVTNNTGDVMRIAQLRNKCVDFIVTEDKPIHLGIGESYVFKNIIPVIHTYTICGSGFCSSSAMGFQNGTEKYVLNVIMDGRYISGVQSPDHWVGNIECPK